MGFACAALPSHCRHVWSTLGRARRCMQDETETTVSIPEQRAALGRPAFSGSQTVIQATWLFHRKEKRVPSPRPRWAHTFNNEDGTPLPSVP